MHDAMKYLAIIMHDTMKYFGSMKRTAIPIGNHDYYHLLIH